MRAGRAKRPSAREDRPLPVGDCQRAFGIAALADGISLISGRSLPGLSSAGHIALGAAAQDVAADLRRIFEALGGDEHDLEGGPHPPLQLDWFHEASRTAIEIDELQHFTSDRLVTLAHYPRNAPLGFDTDEYMSLCRANRTAADRYRLTKEARGFRLTGGRRAQRAYFDSVRDLALPALGYAPVVRVPAIDGDGAAAYGRMRAALRQRLQSGQHRLNGY